MKKHQGFTSVELVVLLLLSIGIGSWIWNAVKFADCDFESDYKCEAIHGIGVFVPPASIITAWFSDDSK